MVVIFLTNLEVTIKMKSIPKKSQRNDILF